MPLSMAAYGSLGCNWSAKCERLSDYTPSQVKLGADCAGTSFATEVRLSPAEVKPIGKSGQRIALHVLTKYCTSVIGMRRLSSVAQRELHVILLWILHTLQKLCSLKWIPSGEQRAVGSRFGGDQYELVKPTLSPL